MANNVTDHNATPIDETDPLRGGTQGGGGGGNNPGGGPDGAGNRGGGTRTDDRADPEEQFDRSRHQSPSTAKQFGRDAADADTQARSPHGAGEPRSHQIFPTETEDRGEGM